MPPKAASSQRPFVAACAAALILFAAAYANSLRNAFHFDDSHVVEQNLFIRDLSNVPRFFVDARTFSALPQNAVYRPVVSLSLAIDHRLGGGLDPLQFHLTQLFLLALVGLLIGFFYLKLFDSTGQAAWHRWAALFATTIFTVHTANSQVGNYISSRSELLAALGVLSAFLVYLHSPVARKYHLYLLPLAFGALAKNHAVMFAPLLLLYKLGIEEQLSLRQLFTARSWPQTRAAIVASLPAFAVSALLFVFIERMAAAGMNYGGGERLPYLATQAWVWVRYVGLYFLPVSFTADSDLGPFTTLTDPRTFAGVALLAASIAALWRASNDSLWRPVAFGIAWFWITLAPTSSIVPLAEVTNDHRAFLPYVGLNAAAIWFACVHAHRFVSPPSTSATIVPRRRLAIGALAVALLVILSASTFQRNKVWRSDETLWADVARKSPQNGRGLMNYGLAKMRRGELVAARDLFLRAQRLLPNYSFVETNLAIVSNALKDPIAAERHFLRSIELDPTQPGAYFFHARFLVSRGDGPGAIVRLERAIALSAGRSDVRHLLMGLFFAQGASAELAVLASETLEMARSDTVAQAYLAGRVPFTSPRDDYASWFALGWSHTRAERHLEAAQAYRVALQRDADQADAWNNLGWTLGKLGFFAEAVTPLERAVRLRPGYALARNNLAWVRMEASKQRNP